MNTVFSSIPGLSSNPDFQEYFWHQLPYGFPVLFSYLIGQIIAVISFLKVFSSKDKKAYIFSFAMTMQGISVYTLIQFSRINIPAQEMILTASRILYFPFMLTAPLLLFLHISLRESGIEFSSFWLLFLLLEPESPCIILC